MGRCHEDAVVVARGRDGGEISGRSQRARPDPHSAASCPSHCAYQGPLLPDVTRSSSSTLTSERPLGSKGAGGRSRPRLLPKGCDLGRGGRPPGDEPPRAARFRSGCRVLRYGAERIGIFVTQSNRAERYSIVAADRQAGDQFSANAPSARRCEASISSVVLRAADPSRRRSQARRVCRRSGPSRHGHEGSIRGTLLLQSLNRREEQTSDRNSAAADSRMSLSKQNVLLAFFVRGRGSADGAGPTRVADSNVA
jgi:hypothetical protein